MKRFDMSERGSDGSREKDGIKGAFRQNSVFKNSARRKRSGL